MFGIREKVLVVDDNKDICEAILMAFEGDLDKECFLANNGEEGLQILENFDIQVIVTDLRMPQMGGLDFVKAIREKGFDTTVIVISGEKKSSDFKELLPLGVTKFFEKPFEMKELVACVEDATAECIVKKVEGELFSQMAKGRGFDFDYETLSPEKKMKFLLSFVSKDLSEDDPSDAA